jgi:ERCC4-type nuclease
MTDSPSFTVVVDHREAPSGVPEALERLGVRVTRATLAVGDYLVGDETRVERKTVRDLHSSVMTRRLWDQLNRLRATSTYPIVLVEGEDLDAGPIPPNGIRGVLVALADRGIPVIRSTDPQDSAAWIRSLALSRNPDKRVQVAPPYRRRVGTRDPVAVSMLCTIRHVSLRNARDLVASFGTLQAVAGASPHDLRAVKGIGRVKSHAIHEALTRAL